MDAEIYVNPCNLSDFSETLNWNPDESRSRRSRRSGPRKRARTLCSVEAIASRLEAITTRSKKLLVARTLLGAKRRMVP